MRFRGSEWGLVTLCAAIIFYQILIPPVVGLADEGDFGKMSQRFYLGPDNHLNEDAFAYFHPRYVRDPRVYHWNAQIVSSELGLIWLATILNNVVSKDQYFDIRVLGVVHAVVLLAALSLFLSCTIVPGLRLANGISLPRLGLFAATAILVILSKPQHALAGIPLGCFSPVSHCACARASRGLPAWGSHSQEGYPPFIRSQAFDRWSKGKGRLRNAR